MSLIELLIATTVMVIVAGALGTLAMTAQTAAEYGYGHSLATQHARVCLERIERALGAATASEQFPGFAVFAAQVGTFDYPDTLVVWHPGAAAADPGGVPRFNELVIFCPDPAAPNRLLEITVPGDTRTAPPVDDAASWQAELAAIKSSSSAHAVQLTDLLKTAEAADGTPRGAVRFHARLRPSQAQWEDYKAGAIGTSDVDWVQGLHGSQTGLRQAWCRFEFQLLPEGIRGKTPPPELALPFFGSGAVYYEPRQ